MATSPEVTDAFDTCKISPVVFDSGKVDVGEPGSSGTASEDGIALSNDGKVWLQDDTVKPLDVPRPTTYAEATNLALRFPEYAAQILALPLASSPSALESAAKPEAQKIAKSKKPARRPRGSGKGTLQKLRPPKRPIVAPRSSLSSAGPPNDTLVPTTAHTVSPTNKGGLSDSIHFVATVLNQDRAGAESGAAHNDRPQPQPQPVPAAPGRPALPALVHKSVDSGSQRELTFARSALGDLRMYPPMPSQALTPLVAPTFGPLSGISLQPDIGYGSGPHLSEVDALIAALQMARMSIAPGAVADISGPANWPIKHHQRPRTSTANGEAEARAREEQSSSRYHSDGMSNIDSSGGRAKSGFLNKSRVSLAGSSGHMRDTSPGGIWGTRSDQRCRSWGQMGRRAPSPVVPGRRSSPFDVGGKLQRPDSAQAQVSARDAMKEERWVTLEEICARRGQARQEHSDQVATGDGLVTKEVAVEGGK